ncbi:hypothetical protein [Geodermatophilus sp. DSM 44513]|uniref:hypothetical protein n=1 Tax=Geodermatophilus sp. DSM 44513 TaxID=1528104 RepID=UPI00127C2E4A|nr:hypothetical protein [Geodermatophilus sp. DSM 44513]WNV76706.1 hypothetical protein RTG05_05380 [Geodermatophilus sp. DSM 44513]
MRAAGLAETCHRRKHRRARPLPAVHADLFQRRFVAQAPDRLWVTDITEHPTAEGKVYCAAVIDFSSRVVCRLVDRGPYALQTGRRRPENGPLAPPAAMERWCISTG